MTRPSRRRRRLRTVALVVTLAVGGGCSGGSGSTNGAPPPRSQAGAVSTSPAAWMPAAVTEAPILGVKWDWDRAANYDSFLQGFGGGDTFYELVWCDVEPAPGLRSWKTVDSVVDGAAAVGFEMNLKIRVGSCWATDSRLDARGGKNKTASLMPRDMAAYEDFVRAVVTRYAPRGVHRYAVENEVNGNGFWQASPADYEHLVRTAAAAIRASDPKAIVLDGGISATAYGAAVAQWLLDQGRTAEAVAAWNAFYERRFAVRGEQLPAAHDAGSLRAALKAEQPARNLSFLETTFRLAADRVTDAYQLHFYEPWGNVPALLAFLHQRLPSGFPIESWETGIFWPQGDDQAVPGETVKLVSLLLAGGVRRVIWLPAAHDPNGRRDEEYRFGLFDPTGVPRPAARLFRDLAISAAGAAVHGLANDGIGGVSLSSAARTVVAVWSDGSGHSAGPLPPGSEVLDSDGGARPAGTTVALDRTARLLRLPEGAVAALAGLR